MNDGMLRAIYNRVWAVSAEKRFESNNSVYSIWV